MASSTALVNNQPYGYALCSVNNQAYGYALCVLCRAALAGSRLITDAGVEYLADPRHAALHRRLRALALNHTAATEAGVCALLARCGGLRSLGVRGLLYNMLSTMECIATNCRWA